MPETFAPITPLLVNYGCDKCGTNMVPAGQAYLTNPPRYPHICPKCGARDTFSETYPVIRWYSPADAYQVIKDGEDVRERPAEAV